MTFKEYKKCTSRNKGKDLTYDDLMWIKKSSSKRSFDAIYLDWLKNQYPGIDF